MKGFARVLLVVSAAWAVAPASVAAQDRDDDFEWSGVLSAGDEIEIRNLAGTISAVPASGNRVEVVASKHGDRRDFEFVEILVLEERGGVTVCAVYNGGGRRSDPCAHGDWDRRDRRGRRGRRNRSIDVDVDFEVRVPAGVDFVASSVSGDIEAEGLRSHVRANSVSGDIFVETSEMVDANTVSGTIEATMGRADWRGDLEFRSVSGDIILTLPDDIDVEVEFQSLSGDIDSDFPITLRSRRNRWFTGNVRGTIGDGGRSLVAQTVSGDLRLRRR